MKEYDYLIVGSGLFGATFAYRAKQAGKKCLVIDKRQHLGGNVYCENIEGINVHKYGAHIFHTSNKEVWGFRKLNSRVQQIYQLACGQLQGQIVQSALQHEYFLPDVGSNNSTAGKRKD